MFKLPLDARETGEVSGRTAGDASKIKFFKMDHDDVDILPSCIDNGHFHRSHAFLFFFLFTDQCFPHGILFFAKIGNFEVPGTSIFTNLLPIVIELFMFTKFSMIN